MNSLLVFTTAFTGLSTATPPCGRTLLNNTNRLASAWVYETDLGKTGGQVAFDILKEQGGSKSLTSVLFNCGQAAIKDGEFVAPSGEDQEYCKKQVQMLGDMGVCAEVNLGLSMPVDSIWASQSSMDTISKDFASWAAETQLSGVSFDFELKGAQHDGVPFGNFLMTLRTHMNPLGIRVTSYSNSWDLTSQINASNICKHADKALCGQGYPGGSGVAWQKSFEGVERDCDTNKISIGLLADTRDKGPLNCDPSTIATRFTTIAEASITEISLFDLNSYNHTTSGDTTGCGELYFPHLQAWLNGPVHQLN